MGSLRSAAARHRRTGSTSIARKSSRRFWFQPPPVVQRSALRAPARLFPSVANAAPRACESAAMSAPTQSAPSGPPSPDTSNAVRSSDRRDSTNGCLSVMGRSDRADIRLLHRPSLHREKWRRPMPRARPAWPMSNVLTSLSPSSFPCASVPAQHQKQNAPYQHQ